jgi:hypothetical protein
MSKGGSEARGGTSASSERLVTCSHVPSDGHRDDSGPQQFTTYRYRWFVLLQFCLLGLVNQLQWITFGPITTISAGYLGVSNEAINMLSLIFMLTYIPGSFIAATLMQVSAGTLDQFRSDAF